jgi:hypothetical protein
MARSDSLFDVFLWPFEDSFYPSVAQVPDPSVQPKASGLFMGEGPVENSLHPAFNKEMRTSVHAPL